MKAALAERLLADVMDWSPEDVAKERPVLQVLADLKYDGYQQFSPGMRFVESLVLWLTQFAKADRAAAYGLIRERLVFLSAAEMSHLSAIAYPDFIRPILLNKAAQAEGLPRYRLSVILNSQTFRRLQSATIFCGLSDGARVDVFRRANRDLSHEQIFLNYELPESKIEEVGANLREKGDDPPVQALVLLDDFSASGTSYFREEDGAYKGKVAKFLKRLLHQPEWKDLVRFPSTVVVVALYAATDSAVKRILEGAQKILGEHANGLHVVVVQPLSDELRIRRGDDETITALADTYYDARIENIHTEKGGTDDLKFGFADCGLPLVLHHNSPNNSLFLLWAEEWCDVRGLFPRVSRHRSDE